MKRSSIRVCWKRSGWEWDLHRHPQLDAAALSGWYREQNRDPSRTRASHERQNANLARVRETLSDDSLFISRNDLTREHLLHAELFVIAGGDNHFTWASHYVPSGLPLLLLNSDISGMPDEGSHGGMLNFSTEEFLDILPQIERDEFAIEEWPLIEVSLAERVLGYATSEVFLGERERTNCSRNFLQLAGIEDTHVGSGTIVATPAGSTGWYYSALQHEARISAFDAALAQLTASEQNCLAALHRAWTESRKPLLANRSESRLYLVNTERFTSSGRRYRLEATDFGPNATLRVTSLNDSEGIVRIDAEAALSFPFPPGVEVSLRIAPHRLQIVKNPFRAR